MPFGPADPGDPPPVQWYGSLERHDCTNLQNSLGPDSPPIWVGLAAVCAAAIEGDGSQWATAEQAAVGAASTGGTQSCLDGPALALLQRAVAWHRLNPGRLPAITFPAAGSTTACPFTIAEVRAVDENSHEFLPGHAQGPLAGGTPIAIVGRGIDNPTRVVLGATAAVVDPSVSVAQSGLGDQKVITVRTPQADHPGTVDVRVTNRAGDVVATQSFTYTADTASGMSTGAG